MLGWSQCYFYTPKKKHKKNGKVENTQREYSGRESYLYRSEAALNKHGLRQAGITNMDCLTCSG